VLGDPDGEEATVDWRGASAAFRAAACSRTSCLFASVARAKSAWRRDELDLLRRKDDAPSEEPVLVFVDDDVEGSVRSLKAAGVKIVTEPREAPWQKGRIVAEFRDSEGNRVVLGSR
jgi:hypothetical protein